MPEKPTFENESYYYEGVMTIAENMIPKPDPQICAVPSSEEADSEGSSVGPILDGVGQN